MADKMSSQDEFVCGTCNTKSEWQDTYYQANTPDGPVASLPKAGYRDISAWYSKEHYRTFCPACGGLVADDGPDGMMWASGSRPVAEGKAPAQGGGHWVLTISEFISCLVPRSGLTFDLDAYKQARAALSAKEEELHKASIADLIDRLRASKGRMANDIEGELIAKGPEAVPFLIKALKDSEVYLRWRTCYVLKAMGEKANGARDALTEALRDSAESVRRGAEDALSSIGSPQSCRSEPELIPSSPREVQLEWGKSLLGVIFSPQATFEGLSRKPSWLLPLLLYMGLMFLYLYSLVHLMGFEKFMRSTLGPNPTDQKVQQIEQFIKMVDEKPGWAALLYINPAVIGLLFPVVLAGILLLVVTLTGGTSSYKKVLSVIAHILFATTLVTTIFAVGPLLISGDFDRFDIQNPIASNVGFFLNPAEMNKFIYSLASSIDLLSFWMIFLLATGLTAVSENLKKRTAYICLIVLWAVWILGKASIALLF